jgi:hypothetical protein
MLADYQVMRDQARVCVCFGDERCLGPFTLHPCAGKQTLAAVSTRWRQARAETADTTVNVAGLAIAVLQLERRGAAGPRRTAGLDSKNLFATMINSA